MNEITRPNRAHTSAGRPKSPLRSTLLLGLILVPVICALTFAAAAYASTTTIRLPPVDPRVLGQIVASFLPTPPSPIPPATITPLPTFQPPAESSTPLPAPSLAAPSPTPSASSTASPTVTFTFTPTNTATPSDTPTPTTTSSATPTSTLTATATYTPSSTPTLVPTATPSRTPTFPPPTATSGPPPTSTWTPSPAPSATPDPSCSPVGNSGFESTLLGLINDERASQPTPLPPYSMQGQLRTAARNHSTDMACNGFFSHDGSDGSSVGTRVTAQGYSWSWVGENIFATSNTSSSAPQTAFDWWMNSAPHRANLLSANYTDIGIGYIYVSGSPYGGYFTAVFARP